MIMERWFSLFLHNFLVSPLEFADTEKTSTHMVCSYKELSKHHSCMNISAYSCLNIVCTCPYSSNIGLSAMTLYYPVQDKTTTRPVNTQNYYTKI